MNTKTQKLIFSKIQNQKLRSKKTDLGIIEDAIQTEGDSIQRDANKLIENSDLAYRAIQNFFEMQSQTIFELTDILSDIDVNESYALIERLEEIKKYDVLDFADSLIRSLTDVESVVDAADQIVRGLENIKTPGIG